VFDGHNGVSAAVFSKEHLLEHVMSALPPEIGSRDDWLQALPRALVAGFVKADIDFQRKGEADRMLMARLQSTPIELVAKYHWLLTQGRCRGRQQRWWSSMASRSPWPRLGIPGAFLTHRAASCSC
jgi:hypothetical protein